MKIRFESPSAKIKMRYKQNVCVVFWTGRAYGEFSHSLSLQATAMRLSVLTMSGHLIIIIPSEARPWLCLSF
jgi:hypothetical protein